MSLNFQVPICTDLCLYTQSKYFSPLKGARSLHLETGGVGGAVNQQHYFDYSNCLIKKKQN